MKFIRVFGFLLLSFQTRSYTRNYNNSEISCVSQAIYHEARGESYTGKLAIGHVIKNRIKKHYANTACDAISQKNQFSWYGKNQGILEIDKWKESTTIAKRILYEKTNDPTSGSLFFHEKHISPGWKYKRVAEIGNHVFYK